MNGSAIETKTVNNKGLLSSLHLYLDPKVNPVIWITNETIDSIQSERTLLFNASYINIKVQKHSIVKQPQPYSSCLNDLTSAGSYSSDCYAKTFQSRPNTKYHYSDCINMCKQKYIWERNVNFNLTCTDRLISLI